MTSPPDADHDRDVAELIDQTAEAADAWMRGDIDRYLDLIHHAPGFTLTAPNGGSPVQFADRRSEFQGWQSPFADGAATLEITAVHAWGDTAILVMVERQHGRIGRPAGPGLVHARHPGLPPDRLRLGAGAPARRPPHPYIVDGETELTRRRITGPIARSSCSASTRRIGLD